jgi:hypothetical protein
MARRKVHVVRKNQRGDKAGRGTWKRQTFGRRYKPKPKRKHGINNRGLRQQLRSKKEFNKTLRETLGLDFVMRAAGMSSGLRKVRVWTL